MKIINKFKFVFFLFVLNSFLFNAHSLWSQSLDAHQILDARGEVYFKFPLPSRSVVEELSQIISLDDIDSGDIYAYANKSEFQKFLAYGINYTVLPPPSTLYPPVMRNNVDIKTITAWDFYPTYSAYESMLYQFQSDYPALCKVYILGTLPSGRKIFALKISDNVNQNEAEPRFYYSSSMHGDEVTGYILMLRLIDYLLSNYGTLPKVNNLVDNIEIWITPAANPDGTYAGGNSTVSGATRENANNKDLNRNYKNPKVGDHPDGNAWQPETIITMGNADSMRYTITANFHGGKECMNYPWDSWYSVTKTHADDAWFQYVSHLYADTARYYSPSTYMNPTGPSFVNGVTHGADWYLVTGTRQDYLTYYTYSKEITMEISNIKTPAASTLPNYWDYNYRSLLNYLEQVLYGLRGIITDSCTNIPIEAQVFITGHDEDNSHVYSFLPHGNYHRPLLAGTYSVTFSAPGYTSKTINNVSISNFNTTVLNVALAPNAPQAVLSSDVTYSCTGSVNFDANIQNADSWLWHFGDGTTSALLNPSHFYTQNGTYNPYLSVTNCSGTQQIHLAGNLVIDKPLPPQVQSDSHCGPSSLQLAASAQGILYWYDSMMASTPVDSGSIFNTPVLTQSTLYFVESYSDSIDHVGETSSNSNGSFYIGSPQHYLVFDCFSPVTLLSAEVNANTAGSRTFYLRNSASQVLDSAVVNISAGVSRIQLNFDIPVGTNLQLAGPPSPDLYRTQSSSINYPFTIPGYISINNSSASTDPTGYYYFFYDWEVKLSECISERVPVGANILNTPSAAFTYLVNTLDVNFTNNSVDALTYFWNFGDGHTSTLENPSNTYASLGSYNVQLIATNTCGTDTFNFTLNLTTDPPIADFSGSPLSVQQGSSVQFTDLSLNNPNQWVWTFEGGAPPNSTLQNPSVTYNTVGNYYVSLKAINPYGNDSITKSGYITVYPLGLAPVADFSSSAQVVTVGDTVFFTDLSQYNPTSWLWNIEGGTPSSSQNQNPFSIYNTTGTYFVSLISSNPYGSDNEMKYNYIQVNPTSVNELYRDPYAFKLFPNPTDNIIFVQSEDINSKINTVDITDVLGHKVLTFNFDNDISTQSGILKLPVQNLKAGLYIISLNTNSGNYCLRFVKK